MLLDALLVFDDNVALTVTRNGTNVVDLSAARDLAPGEDLYLVSYVTTTFTAGGAATLTTTLVTDDNASLSSPLTIWTSPAIAVASMVAGFRLFAARIPRAAVASSLGERYLGIVHTVATGPFTAGKLFAGITLEAQDDSSKFYPRSVYPVA